MNMEELVGSARSIGGKVEKTICDTIESREWQADGLVDQVAGEVQHAYGRATSIVGDVVGSAPELAERGRDHLMAAGEHATAAVQRGSDAAIATVRERPAIWAIAGGVVALALAWLIHARR